MQTAAYAIVRVQAADFQVAQLQQELLDGVTDVGAVATFVGIVRDQSDAQNVRALTLEHYPGMTEKSMQAIVEQALSRFDVQRVMALHRVGRLVVGEQIVYVGVCSAHRKAALEACSYVIDLLKTKAVFWKKEETDKAQTWLLPTQADSDIADGW